MGTRTVNLSGTHYNAYSFLPYDSIGMVKRHVYSVSSWKNIMNNFRIASTLTTSISHTRTVPLKLEQQSTNTKSKNEWKKNTVISVFTIFPFFSARINEKFLALCVFSTSIVVRWFGAVVVFASLCRFFPFSCYLHFYRKIHVMRLLCVDLSHKHCTPFASIEFMHGYENNNKDWCWWLYSVHDAVHAPPSPSTFSYKITANSFIRGTS